MSLATLDAGVPWDFETFPQYLDSVERHGTALNYGCYVGHTAVRLWVMGEAGYERAATDDELARMRAVVADAIAAGAAGFATSSSTTHSGDGGRPVPSRLADLHELNTLLEPLRDAGRGVAALLPGETIKHDDVFEIQRLIGRPLTWTALLTIKNYPWHERIMERNVAARADGIEVWPQVSCRPLVFQMNLKEPFTFNMRPIFAALMDSSFEARRRTAIRRGAPAWDELNGRGVLPPNWASLAVAESATHPELIGRPLPELAEERGCTPLDVMLDVSLSEDLETRFTSVLANNDPDAIAWLLPQETVLLGLADSGAHVSQLCDACFATDLLGNWVRDREVMPMERAIYKLTGEPAASTASPTAARSRRARPPTSPCSTPTPSRPDRCGACTTSPPTASARRRRARRPLAHARERGRRAGRRCRRRRGAAARPGAASSRLTLGTPGLTARHPSGRSPPTICAPSSALLADDDIGARRESSRARLTYRSNTWLPSTRSTPRRRTSCSSLPASTTDGRHITTHASPPSQPPRRDPRAHPARPGSPARSAPASDTRLMPNTERSRRRERAARAAQHRQDARRRAPLLRIARLPYRDHEGNEDRAW